MSCHRKLLHYTLIPTKALPAIVMAVALFLVIVSQVQSQQPAAEPVAPAAAAVDQDEPADEALTEGETGEQPVSTSTANAPERPVTPPVAFSLEPSVFQPEDVAPLAGRLELSTNIPTRVEFDVHGNGEQWHVAFQGEPREFHDIPLLGLAPASEYHVENLQVQTADGQTLDWSAPLVVTTQALPEGVPAIDILYDEPELRSDSLILFAPMRGQRHRTSARHVMVVDRQGTTRWLCYGLMLPVRQSPTGTFFGLSRGIPVEVDVYGNVLRRWVDPANDPFLTGVTLPPFSREGYHHEALLLANGNMLTLGRKSRMVPNFPTSEMDPTAHPTDQLLETDPIMEVRPDGSVANSIDLLDILDPYRFGYGTIVSDRPQDWAHSNALAYDEGDPENPDDDAVLISVRHQDAIVKIAYPSGKLIWILGSHDGWGEAHQPYLLTPTNPDVLEWSYHTHSPMILPNGDILLFDNGNFRAHPFVSWPIPPQKSYSRAVIYRVDDAAKTVTQVWEYGGQGLEPEKRIFSTHASNAEWLPETKTVLVTFSRPLYIGGEMQQINQPRILEVTDEGKCVFEMRVSHGEEMTSLYRAHPVTSLYPPEYHVTATEPAPPIDPIAAKEPSAEATNEPEEAEPPVGDTPIAGEASSPQEDAPAQP